MFQPLVPRSGMLENEKMQSRTEDKGGFADLELRIRTMLPARYQESYQNVQPVSMGSAALKYGSDGRVAWDEIWGSFCDLAMAGGPPHRGRLLEPGSREEIKQNGDRYQEVLDEVCRGLAMVTGLSARPADLAGWVRVDCTSGAMAGWLARSIVMENVSARFKGLALLLPVGPAYRLEKEIKNVITAMAKTSHYWREHMSYEQHLEIGALLRTMDRESPLLQPPLPDDGIPAGALQALSVQISESIYRTTGLQTSKQQVAGWIGLNCPDSDAAIRIMRTLFVCNVYARREETSVCVPINPLCDPEGRVVVAMVGKACQFAMQEKQGF
jgi:sirohydrochlorin cobaltochelatase